MKYFGIKLSSLIDKRITVVFLSLILSMGKAHTQSFSPVGSGFNRATRSLLYDTSANILYVSGGFSAIHNGPYANTIAQWNGINWDSLGSGVNDGGSVITIAKYNNQIYCGGGFSLIGGITAKGIARWDGNYWAYFADIVDKQGYGAVLGLYVNGSDLYAMGWIDSINGISVNRIGKFDGNSWSSFPFLDSINAVYTAIIYNGELYVGGNFQSGFGKWGIAKFDGTNWVSVGGGLGFDQWVNCFAIYQGKLYVGGYFQTSAGSPGNNIAIWDGINWSQPDSGVMPANVWAMKEYNGELYVGGQISSAGSLPVTDIAKWDGTQWHDIGGIFDNAVGCLEVHNNDLYIGGGFWTINGDSMMGITKYSNSVGIAKSNDNLNCFMIYHNPLIKEITIEFEIEVNQDISGIWIYSIEGKLEKEFDIKKLVTTFNKVTLSMESFKSGIYLLEIKNSKGKNYCLKKFVID